MEDRNCGCNNQEFMKGECKFETPQGINAIKIAIVAVVVVVNARTRQDVKCLKI